MDLGLKDRIALVTGTGSQVGFGREIALYLAQEGCHVVSLDLDLEGAQKTAADVAKTGRKAIAVKANVLKRAEIDAAVERAIEEFGRIDILCNTVGLCSGAVPFTESTPEQWDVDIDTNLKGTMGFMHAVLPYMIQQHYGKIVNFSTHCAHQAAGIFGVSPYIAAKAGLSQLSRSLQNELGDQGININVVAPGPGNTNFYKVSPEMAAMGRDTEIWARAGKTVLPSDIAYTVAFLVSDLSRLVRGQVIEVMPYIGPGYRPGEVGELGDD